MYNEAETKALVALMNRLGEEQSMIGWLCTVHRNKVTYKDNPQAVKGIQEQLNRAANLISLAYIWAILDESGFNEHNKWITSDNRLKLKAWKHVRHTGAHAPTGRANGYYNEFDEFMTNGTGLSGLKENCKWDADSIELTDGMNFRFFTWIRHLAQQAVGFCANNNEP